MKSNAKQPIRDWLFLFVPKVPERPEAIFADRNFRAAT
jgi:hypothetical protein